ncbi:uncharacterized protein A1O9_01684 [Exophiala aquamarina CBS 119918]|uniref:Uncharacterized protein n=1 Tax=Exophiala aquamarina CBS 119918 TaxID=1182545 RepID=A0A072PV33_9EURO|nr:uncharacterized protein A1O9_01684 [Exophiala aquamarina CBS 119918]KEF63706.1 hypothetical protein A1O9_01684 [Exophiala aquamarina CBS 119918]
MSAAFQQDALEMLRSIFMPFNQRHNRSPKSRHHVQLTWQSRVKELLPDKQSLYGWYASVLSLKAHFEEPEHYATIWPMALKQQNKSLFLLRSRIVESHKPSETLLQCIWYNAALAFYQGDVSVNECHKRAFADLIQKLGGIDVLTPTIRLQVIHGENVHSRHVMARPALDFGQYDPGSFYDQCCFREYTLISPEAKSQYRYGDDAFLLPDDPLSARLGTYLSMHREFVTAHCLAEDLDRDKKYDEADRFFDWLYPRRSTLNSWTMTLFFDLVETITPATPTSRAVRRQLQACLALSSSYAMSFAYGFLSRVQRWLLYVPIQNLQPQIEVLLTYIAKRGFLYGNKPNFAIHEVGTMYSGAIDYYNALLYIFFVGACAEQASNEAGKRPVLQTTWHSVRFAYTSQLLGLRTWREAQKLLTRFVYADCVMDRFVEGLFEARWDLVKEFEGY